MFLVVGSVCVVFSKPIGIRFSRIGSSMWTRRENGSVDRVKQGIRRLFPALSPYDETRAPMTFRFLGIIFLIQAVLFLVLSALM